MFAKYDRLSIPETILKIHSLKLFVAAVGFFGSIAAHAYSGLVVFGDSLSDSGSAANFGAINPGQVITGNSYIPSAAYSSGTFSNGPVWATLLATQMANAGYLPSSYPLSPAWNASPSGVGFTGGTNFAIGGAVTNGGFPSLSAQVGAFTTSFAAFGSPTNALYVIAGGGNNVRAAVDNIAANPASFGSILGTAAFQYANDVGNMVDALQAKGVASSNIIVWNTPNVGLTPAVLAKNLPGAPYLGSASFFATTVSDALNGALANRLASETGVRVFDLFNFINGAVANPASLGLSNVTDACGAGSVSCATALFYDGIHPTTFAQGKVADAMFAMAVPEPSEIAMMLMGLLVIVGFARRKAA
jgi:outer membrane lipase/esterase